ncbi:MAG: hypothetical protein ACERK6_11945 [Candidatus Aminicenantaceae bacterium]
MKPRASMYRSGLLTRPAAGAFLALLLVFTQTGCGDYKMDSLWLTEPITIDGDSSDWRGALYYLKDDKASVGIRNDRENLYVCLITQDPTLSRQALNLGLILWIDPAGGKEKLFGINYPIGARENFRLGPGRDPEGLDPEQMQEELRNTSLESLHELRFLDAEGQELDRLELEQLEGMEIAVETSRGIFVYELRIPLISDQRLPFVLAVQAGQTIGIGLEIPKVDREEMRQSMGGGNGEGPPGGGTGGRSGGGMGGMGGRGGGGKGGRPGGGRENFDQDLLKGKKIWSKIHLAIDSPSYPSLYSLHPPPITLSQETGRH